MSITTNRDVEDSTLNQEKDDMPLLLSWRDDDLKVEFPSSLAGNHLLGRQTYETAELGYSLRYGCSGTVKDAPHFDLYVYDNGDGEIPDGISRPLVAQLAISMASISDSSNPLMADGRFPDELSVAKLEKTGIPLVASFGSFRDIKRNIPFGTAIVLFAYHGKYIKIRYSEPWTAKSPESIGVFFERIEERLFNPQPTMEEHVWRFLDSLDGLLYGAMKRCAKNSRRCAELRTKKKNTPISNPS